MTVVSQPAWHRDGEAWRFIALRYLPWLAALDLEKALGRWHWRRIVALMLVLGPGYTIFIERARAPGSILEDLAKE